VRPERILHSEKGSIAGDSRLVDLIARWEAARENGIPISPEELCKNCPEFLEPLRSAIARRHGNNSVTVSALEVDTGPTTDLGTKRLQPPAHRGTSYQPGQTVAEFTLLREIGKGGFGQVFETEDSFLRRRVAIKFLHSKALEDPAARDQFLGEARAMAALNNDHVVPIYQVGQDGDNLFLVMPLLAGETLAAKLDREGILPPDECVRIAHELTAGLSAIHAKGLIHRDLKPANVWLEAGTGRVKILDLGLADEVENLRQAASAGTPAFMSPEQVDGETLDFRSDLFSLGAILYECLTARRAFPGRTLSETIDAVRRAQPLPLDRANPAAPAELRELVEALLQKERQRRPVSAQAVAAALLQPGDVSSHSVVSPTSPIPVRRWRWLVGGAVALVLISLGFFALLSRLDSQPTMAKRSSSPSPKSPQPLPPLTIEQLEVTPLQPLSSTLWKDLPPLSRGLQTYMTTEHAIDVKAKLSRPAYCYMLLYRSDGEHVLLFPHGEEVIPPLTDQPRYPPRGENVAYQLNDGPGVWVVSVVASDRPLPSYQDWKATHTSGPWEPHDDPQQLAAVLIDNGQTWTTPTRGGGFAQNSRGEIKISGRARIKPLVDWWTEQSGGAVKALAFPVVEK
jgi:serine/threonine protein kinase